MKAKEKLRRLTKKLKKKILKADFSYKDLVIIGLIIIILGFLKGCNDMSSRLFDLKQQNEAISQKKEVFKDKFGREVTKNISLTGKIDYLKNSRDSAERVVANLKDSLKDAVSIIYVSNSTDIKKSGSAKITKVDTSIEDSVVKVYPTYMSHFKDKWYDIMVIQDKDSSDIDVKVKNEYKYFVENKRDSWIKFWKPKKLHFTAYNLNPYTSTGSVASYVKTDKDPLFSISTQVGGGVLIPFDGGLTTGLYGGFGVSANIVEVIRRF